MLRWRSRCLKINSINFTSQTIWIVAYSCHLLTVSRWVISSLHLSHCGFCLFWPWSISTFRWQLFGRSDCEVTDYQCRLRVVKEGLSCSCLAWLFCACCADIQSGYAEVVPVVLKTQWKVDWAVNFGCILGRQTNQRHCSSSAETVGVSEGDNQGNRGGHLEF